MIAAVAGLVGAPSVSPALAFSVAEELTVPTIDYETETLANGLQVIYAPMDNAPVVHVRVLYHVGSRDEQPDRRGFAHMFEHMMFRGSAHVASEQHMDLINATGGNSNAFTSFDQTTYINTVPSNHLEMALYLEADRMASFQVTPSVLDTERNVVNEEWRLRVANPPYGELFEDLFELAYEEHHYQWTPIGDMDDLAAAQPHELQAFHDVYYNPNNAALIIAGQFDVEQAKQWVDTYYAWIPAGDDFDRPSPVEPEQTETKKKVVYKTNIPLTQIVFAWKTTDYGDDDQYALNMLSSILGDGRSSRLYEALVGNDTPIATAAQAGNQQLQDQGLLLAFIGLLPSSDPDASEAALLQVIERIKEEGPTEEELAKAKTQAKLGLINSVATANSVATRLGEEAVFGGDIARVNRAGEKIEAVTVEDIKRVANTYLTPQRLSILHYRPGVGEDFDSREADEAPATQEAAAVDFEDTLVMVDDHATTQPATQSVAVGFPADWPTEPPYNTDALSADFVKGETFTVNGVKVIVLPDDRIPTVTWDLILPTGGHVEPAGKEGLASITASMLSRGVEGMTSAELSEQLEARGIAVGVSDNGDHTRVSGRTTVDQFGEAVELTKLILATPTFPADEFAKLKAQAQSGLTQTLVNPSAITGREMSTALYGASPLGRNSTLQSLAAITLDDVKAWYETVYQPTGAMLFFAGDVDRETAETYAEQLTADWKAGEIPSITYELPARADQREIIIVDNPTGQQAEILMGIRAYDNQSDDRFAGSVASQILSNGIDSRMNQYLRAEKGLTYGASAFFNPGRIDGRFAVSVATRPETAAEAITSSFEVLQKMIDEPVTTDELEEAQQIVSGFMVMQTQTIGQQAGRRVTIELNGYPIDYYDTLPRKVNAVTLEDVQRVMRTHVDPEKFTIVMVGPAEVLKPQLDGMGEITVLPMPLQR